MTRPRFTSLFRRSLPLFAAVPLVALAVFVLPHPSDDVQAEPDPGSGSLSQPATEILDGSGEESARA